MTAAPENEGTVPAQGASLALYRKYRPATFAEVRGQEHVTGPLRQALRTGRIHHAYLFSGPRGCGKTSSARILARSLNCVNGPTPDPCGVCDSCAALAPSGPGSIDVIEIDAASHGGVDDARELRERAFYTPVSGRFKIYIIDEAHMVTQQGFNALLKLVEEPPPHLKFIFATTEPEKVIPTIRSRTHHYPFRLVPPSVLRELMQDILRSEGVTVAESVLPLVVRAGAGSVRDSLSILDQLLAGSDESGLSYERAVALLGYTDASLLDEITDAFAASDGAAVFRVVNQVIEGGHEPRRFAADMLDRFRDLIVLAAVPDAAQTGLLDVPPDRAERMAAQAGRFGQAGLTRAAEIVSSGLDQMRGATSPRLLLELMCAQVLLPAAATDEKSLLARLERLEAGIREAPAPVPQAPSSTVPQAPSSTVPQAPSSTVPQAPSSTVPQAPSSTVPQAPSNTVPQAPSNTVPQAPPPTPHAGKDGYPERAVGSPAAERHAPEPPRAPAPGPSAPGPSAPPPAAPGEAAARRTPAAGATSSAAGQPSADSLRENWGSVLEEVKQERRVAWILLSNASVLSLQDGVLTLRFARDGDLKAFSTSGHDVILKKVLNSAFGLNVTVRGVVGGGAGSGATSAQPGSGPRSAGQGTRPGGAGGGPRGPGGAGGSGGTGTGAAGQRGSAAPGFGSPGSGAPGFGTPGSGAPGSGAPGFGAPGFGGRRNEPLDDLPPEPDEMPDEMPSDDMAAGGTELTGMELIQRELGGQVIGEIEE